MTYAVWSLKRRSRKHRKTKELTFVFLKPDAVARGLVGAIIARIEGTPGMKIRDLRMVRLSQEEISLFQPSSSAWAKKAGERAVRRFERAGQDPRKIFGSDDPYDVAEIIRANNRKYFSWGPMVGIIIEGYGAIRTIRKLAGATSPSTAEVGTIRRTYGNPNEDFDVANRERRPCLNILHTSGSKAEAKKDIARFRELPVRPIDPGISPILIGILRKQGLWNEIH